jgi:cobalt transporter subunit CbtA
MTKHLVSSAVFAGLVAGLCAALLQFLFVTPLLLEGELFESGARMHFAHAGSTPQSPAGAPSLAEEPMRHALTLAMNLVTYTGFALLMVAGFAIADRSGHRLTPRSGLVWGLAGFLAIQLAPAVGLPPELPGTVAADLVSRQIWWVATAASTIGGLALIAFGGNLLKGLIGTGLILLPQLVGAPHPEAYFGIAPPELSAQFATASLGVAAASWAVLGLATAYFWTRPAQ